MRQTAAAVERGVPIYRRNTWARASAAPSLSEPDAKVAVTNGASAHRPDTPRTGGTIPEVIHNAVHCSSTARRSHP
jgi:hypothetical protein